MSPSIQTAPLAFKPKVTDGAYVDTFTTNLFRVVAHLIEVEAKTGHRVEARARARTGLLPRNDG